MPELPWLPEAPHAVIQHPPLAMALCQVRYGTMLGVADPSFVAPFQRAIQDRYPVGNSGDQLEAGPALAPGESTIRSGASSHQWRFADAGDTWVVVLTPDFVTIETRAYDDFGDFLDRLRHLLMALVEHIRPSLSTRLGLRYVNEIRPGHQDWSSIIRQELLGPLSVPELKVEARQTMQQLVFRYPNEEGITISHGLIPRGTLVQPPQGGTVPDEPFYVLDFDMFHEFRPPLALDVARICAEVEGYNKVIYRLFRWSVTDEYVSALEVRQHASS